MTKDIRRSRILILTNVSGGGSVFVGQVSDVQGKRTCDFVDGGLCANAGGADVPVQFVAKLGPYATLLEAEAAYCSSATNAHSVSGGTKVDIFGASYWADNINFSCPVATP